MIAAALALSFVAPAFAGAILTRALLPRGGGTAAACTRAGLALGFGLGLASLACWIALLAGGHSRGAIVVADALLVGLALLVARRVTPPPATAAAGSGVAWWWWAAAALAIVLATVDVTSRTVAMPHGDFDAVAIWNMRAVFLVRAPGEWTTVFSPRLAHTDYPLLVPLLVARAWLWAGSETVLAPALVAFAFLLATTLLLFGAVAERSGPGHAAVAAIVLLATPVVREQAAAQGADLPLAYWWLAVVVLLVRVREGPHRNLAFLLGLAAGLAAWTKNEGMLLALLAGAVGLVAFWRARPLQATVLMLGGAAFAWLPLVQFKTAWAPRNDLFPPRDVDAFVARLTDFGRWREVGAAWAPHLLWYRAGGGGGFLGAVPLAVWAALVGRDRSRPRPVVLAGMLAATVVVYLLVQVTTPYGLDWHLLTTTARLLSHVWPAFLFLLFATRRGGHGMPCE